jgi:hypothetical protein
VTLRRGKSFTTTSRAAFVAHTIPPLLQLGSWTLHRTPPQRSALRAQSPVGSKTRVSIGELRFKPDECLTEAPVSSPIWDLAEATPEQTQLHSDLIEEDQMPPGHVLLLC